jgi:predicted PurR-regulated permease PerM
VLCCYFVFLSIAATARALRKFRHKENLAVATSVFVSVFSLALLAVFIYPLASQPSSSELSSSMHKTEGRVAIGETGAANSSVPSRSP